MAGAPTPCGRLDLPRIGIDEQRDFRTAAAQPLHRLANARLLAGDIQTTLCGQLLAGFRYQADMLRPQLLGKGQHRLSDTHLEIHPRLQGVLHHQHIAFLDMSTVLAQVHGNAVRACLFGVQRGLDRVRIAGAAGLAQGGDMVDVDTEQDSIGFSHAGTPSDS